MGLFHKIDHRKINYCGKNTAVVGLSFHS